MSKTAFVLAASAVTIDPTSLSDAGVSRIQLFTAGRNQGRDGRIAEVGDLASMQAIVAATVARAGSTEPVVDYDHQSIFASVPGVGGRAPAAGWMKRIEAADDGIWADVEWTPAAAAAIRAGEYRYVSPVYFAEKSGAVRVIVNAALTNSPCFDLAEATAASVIVPPEITPPEGNPMEKLAKALGLAADATEDQILAAIGSRNATLVAVAAAAKTEATGTDLVAAVSNAVTAAVPDATKFVPIGLLHAANAKIADLTAGAAADKVKLAVDDAIAAGKLPPAQKDWAMSYASVDLAGFTAFVASAPVIVGQGGKVVEKRLEAGAGVDATDLEVCRAMGLDPAAFKKIRDAEEKH